MAPLLVFTMEDVWLERYNDADASVHLVDIPETPAAWLNPELATKWETIRNVRRVVTGAIEVERTAKNIGSSLEAAPIVGIVDDAVKAVVGSVDFNDICITSAIAFDVVENGFSLDDVAGVSVQFEKATGDKCQRCWKVTPEVGSQTHEGCCKRCSDALA